MKRSTTALLLLFAFLFATTAFADTLRFRVAGMDCSSCAPPVVRALKALPGVTAASVDWKSGNASLQSTGPIDAAAVRTALNNAGFNAIFAGESGSELQPLPESQRAQLDILTDRDGSKFDIAKLIVPGKVTIIDFYGDWCGPCRVLELRLEHYLAGHPGIALRRIDIGKWDNDAARQATREFRTSELPYVRLYYPNGTFSSAVTGGMWDEVTAAIEKASR